MFSNRTVIAILITGIIYTGFMLLSREPESAHADHFEGVTGVMSAKARAKPARHLSILFIGNSYTFVNNMPSMVVEIAKSDRGNPVTLDVQAAAWGAVTLEDIWKVEEARQVLRQRKWDYVVLQDNSLWVLDKNSIKDTTGSVANWVGEIRSVNSQPILTMTWVRQPGSQWYTDPKYSYLTKTPDYFLQRLQTQTYGLAEALDIPVMPVGVYWYFATQNHPELNLYWLDGTHPGPGGSYLAALLFYRFFTGRSPEAVTYRPSLVSKEHAMTIRKIAAYGGK